MWENLIASIVADIKANGTQDIDGPLLQERLVEMVNALGANATVAGIATPDSNPGAPDGPLMYIATTKGTYNYFGGIEIVEDGVYSLSWTGTGWIAKVWIAFESEFRKRASRTELAFGTRAEYVSNEGTEITEYVTGIYKYYQQKNEDPFYVHADFKTFTHTFSADNPNNYKPRVVYCKNVKGANHIYRSIFVEDDNGNVVLKSNVSGDFTFTLYDKWSIQVTCERFFIDCTESPVLSIKTNVDANVSKISAFDEIYEKTAFISSGAEDGFNTTVIESFPSTDGKIYGVRQTTTVNQEGYSYAYARITEAYQEVSEQTLRLVVRAESECIFIMHLSNGLTSWGGGDAGAGTALGIALSQALEFTEKNDYTQVVDINMSDIDISTFYSDPSRANMQHVTLFLTSSTNNMTPLGTHTLSWFVYDLSQQLPNYLSAKTVSNYITDSWVKKYLNDEIGSTIESLTLPDNYITCWGDSLTAMGGWTTTLGTLAGRTVYNGGTGGEKSDTIIARQGADVMTVNNITIPADLTPVLIADRDIDGGITTQFGRIATPLLQGGSAHVNPCEIGGVEGTLSWTGANYADMTGDWTFTRSVTGSEVVINRPTAIKTAYDRERNRPHLMIVFIGQNGGYDDIDHLIWQYKKTVEHAQAKYVICLGFSSGTASQRATYEEGMRKEFGRYFISLREYLSAPVFDVDGTTVISSYGLDDAGLVATQADLDAIAVGSAPPQLFSDGIHYTTDTKTVIGNMIYKKCIELGIF